MKVIDALRQRRGNVLSVEIEPPHIGAQIQQIYNLLDPLVAQGISYIDITYHPEQIVGHVTQNGQEYSLTQRKKPGTVGVAGAISGRYKSKGVEAVPHVICTGFSAYETEEYLIDLAFLGVENVFALRGDPLKGSDGTFLPFVPVPGGHEQVHSLIQQIADLKNARYIGATSGSALDFCIGAACYLEGHKDSPSWEFEMSWLKAKVDKGAEYLVTQMFFDAELYSRFVERAQKAHLDVPIVPGIFPVSAYRYVETLPQYFHCSIPTDLVRSLERWKGNKEDMKKAGIEWCVDQCRQLRQGGAPSLHFFATRNAPVEEVLQTLQNT